MSGQGLNLVPDPVIVGLQMGVFLATSFVVKKWILTPYLELKESQDQLTTGQREKAGHLLKEVEHLKSQIDSRLKVSSEKVKNLRAENRAETATLVAKMIEEAEQKAKDFIAENNKDLHRQIDEQKHQIKQGVAALKEQILSALLEHNKRGAA